MGRLARARWPRSVQEAIRQGSVSISPLELLAAAIAVRIASEVGAVPTCGRMALRCDNESACAAANSWTAASAPMLAALRVLHRQITLAGCEVHFVHIPTKANRIADGLSRMADVSGAAKEVWAQPHAWPPPTEWESWADEICSAGWRARCRTQPTDEAFEEVEREVVSA